MGKSSIKQKYRGNPSEKMYEFLTDFSGGMNTKLEDSLLKDFYARNVTNFDIVAGGLLSKRKGFKAIDLKNRLLRLLDTNEDNLKKTEILNVFNFTDDSKEILSAIVVCYNKNNERKHIIINIIFVNDSVYTLTSKGIDSKSAAFANFGNTKLLFSQEKSVDSGGDGGGSDYSENDYEGSFSTPEKEKEFFALSSVVNEGEFQNEPNLKSITLPSVSRVKYYGFENSPLLSLTIPNVTRIGETAFKHAYLMELSIPKAIEIGNNAFLNSHLSNLSLPEATTIGFGAFKNSELRNLYIPKVTRIGYAAFFMVSWIIQQQ